MEILLKQRFSYARVTPFKNYTPINDKNNKIKDFKNDELCDKDMFLGNFSDIKNYLYLPTKSNRNINFFYSDNNQNKKIIIDSLSKNPKQIFFYTKKDCNIKKHYNNPFSSIEIYTIERSIIKRGDKVSIKSYTHIKTRSVNCKYFKKSTAIHIITINIKKGNFFTSIIELAGKVKSKKIKQNSFSDLNKLYNLSPLFVAKSSFAPLTFSRLHKEFHEEYNDIKFGEVLSKTLDINYYPTQPKSFMIGLMDNFLKLKNIKAPNDYYNWIENFYPTEKYLKKNDRKLIASILDMLNIKSKFLIKKLHQHPNINMEILVGLITIFGDDYYNFLNKLNFNKISINHNAKITNGPIDKFKCLNPTIFSNYELNTKEKNNIISIINNNVDTSSDFVRLLNDHLIMLNKLTKDYNEVVSITAKNMDEFHAEHMELTKLLQINRKGWVTVIEYDNEFINEIEKEYPNVDDNNIIFKPTILKREEQYIEEGTYMHHCVSSYVDNQNSIIISIRRLGHKDRVTCEYDVKTGINKQSRYFCNEVPPNYFNLFIDYLNSKMMILRNMNKLKPIDVKKEKISNKNINHLITEIPFQDTLFF